MFFANAADGGSFIFDAYFAGIVVGWIIALMPFFFVIVLTGWMLHRIKSKGKKRIAAQNMIKTAKQSIDEKNKIPLKKHQDKSPKKNNQRKKKRTKTVRKRL